MNETKKEKISFNELREVAVALCQAKLRYIDLANETVIKSAKEKWNKEAEIYDDLFCKFVDFIMTKQLELERILNEQD